MTAQLVEGAGVEAVAWSRRWHLQGPSVNMVHTRSTTRRISLTRCRKVRFNSSGLDLGDNLGDIGFQGENLKASNRLKIL